MFANSAIFSSSTPPVTVLVWSDGIWCYEFALSTAPYNTKGTNYKYVVMSDDDPDAIDFCITEHLDLIFN